MSTYVRWIRGKSHRRITRNGDKFTQEESLTNEIDSSLREDRKVPDTYTKVKYETNERKFKAMRKTQSLESGKNQRKLGFDRQFACEKLTSDHKSHILGYMMPKLTTIGLIINPDYIVKEFKTNVVSSQHITKDGFLFPASRSSKHRSEYSPKHHECIVDPRMKLDKPCFIGLAISDKANDETRKLVKKLSDKYNLIIKEIKSVE